MVRGRSEQPRGRGGAGDRGLQRHRRGDGAEAGGRGGEIEKRFEDMDVLQAEDIADAIAYAVTRPRHVAVNEILVRPTEQEL